MNPLGRRSLVVLCATAFSFSSLLSAQDPVPVAVPALGTPSVIPHDGIPDILTGTASLAARAKLFSGAPGHPLLAQGAPFGEAFPGGLRVASGDVTGDGVGDAIVAMGPGVIAGRVAHRSGGSSGSTTASTRHSSPKAFPSAQRRLGACGSRWATSTTMDAMI